LIEKRHSANRNSNKSGCKTTVKTRNDTERVFIAILAAGNSTRFGSTKQLADIHGESLVLRCARIAAGVRGPRTLLLLGNEWQAVSRSASQQCSFFALNEHPSAGIGSSIAIAAKILRSRADAILIVLVDQVLISSEHLQNLIDSWSGSTTEIVATTFANGTGPPALFPRAAFDDLSQLTGNSGAHALLDDSRFDTVRIPFADAAVDIDTAADLRRVD
jgi:molybdenum cofactor cytidylyltransferase